jgi:hypothetical protein
MTVKELREEIKRIIIAQGGEIYNFNYNNLKARYGITVTQFQNTVSYFQYSPQQAKFRETYNFH